MTSSTAKKMENEEKTRFVGLIPVEGREYLAYRGL
jgi:hypothetical protein